MNRRAVMRLVASAGGSTLLARGTAGQPRTAVRRVAILVANREGDPESQHRVAALRLSLAEAGWTDGRNVEIAVSYLAGDAERARSVARDVVGQAFDVIVVNGTPGLTALKVLTNVIPIVFVVVTDPVGEGFVESLSRPGGNITGFSTFEPETAGKWLELLHGVKPDLERVGILIDRQFSGFLSLARRVEELAPRLGITAESIDVRSLTDLEAKLPAFARHRNAGLIVAPSPVNTVNRAWINAQTIAHRLPAIWSFAFHARSGALMAYGFDPADLFRRAGPYVARILNGEKAGELPVQAPTKFELVINLATARAMGLTIPPTILVRADEVIE